MPKKKTLSFGKPLTLKPVLATGARLRWSYDDRLRPAIKHENDSEMVLELDRSGNVRPGFYRLDADVVDALGTTIRTEEHTVRVQSTSEVACQNPTSPAPSDTTPSAGAIAAYSPPVAAPERQAATVAANLSYSAENPLDSIDDGCNAVAHAILPAAVNLDGDYRVQLRRNDSDVKGADAPIVRGRTLHVGRGDDCELCLGAHFLNGDLSKKCSRRQLEIFWVGQRIHVKNVGANAMKFVLESGRVPLSSGASADWPAHVPIEIPGMLELRMRRC